MKNKIIAVIGIIALSLIIINMSASHSKLNKSIDSKNTITLKTQPNYIEYYVGNSKSYKVPEQKDEYMFNPTKSKCTGTTVSWDYNNWKPIIKDNTNGIECSLYFDDAKNITDMFKAIKALSKTSTQDGIYYFDDTGNLDYGNGSTKISVANKDTNIKGLVSIWDNELIYTCLKDNSTTNSYSYYYNDGYIESSKYPCSTKRYENLVTNGDLSYKSNFNFEQLNYKDGYFYTNSYYFNLMPSEYIPIDPNKKYQISADIKSNNTSAYYFAGISEYDLMREGIYANNTMYINNTDTYLTQDLKNGDTEVHVASLANWQNTNLDYQRSIIFWNKVNPITNKYYDIHTIGNNYYNLYDDYSKINKTNNIIKLRNAWTGGNISMGTRLSQGNSGSSFNYSVQVGTLPTNFTNYSSKITGYGTNNQQDKFREPTHFIKFLLLINYNNTPNTTTYIKNIVIKEIK